MLLTKVSDLSGKEHTMDLPITPEEIKRFNAGEKVQHIWPHLTADQREFILTGITAQEWDEAFPEEEDDHVAEMEADREDHLNKLELQQGDMDSMDWLDDPDDDHKEQGIGINL